MKNVKLVFIFLIFNALYIYGIEFGELSFSITPGGVISLGDSTSYFKFGGGAGLVADISINSPSFVFIRTEADYEYLPIVTEDGVSLFSISAGPGLKYNPLERLTLSVFGTGGYYYCSMTDGSGSGGGNMALTGGISAYYDINPSFSLGVKLGYTTKTALYSGLGLSIGTSIRPGRFGSYRSGNQYGSAIDLLEALSPGVSGSGLDVETISFN